MSTCGDLLDIGVDENATVIGSATRALPDLMFAKVNRLLDQFDLWVAKDKVYNFVEASRIQQCLENFLTTHTAAITRQRSYHVSKCPQVPETD